MIEVRIRVHDLRGTFVTLSLANGRTEAWVADRTGHRSSVMINRYRRAARTATEPGLGLLAPLNEAMTPPARGQARGLSQTQRWPRNWARKSRSYGKHSADRGT